MIFSANRAQERRTDETAVICDFTFMSCGNVLCVKCEIDYLLDRFTP
jgi:hypothetical protein